MPITNKPRYMDEEGFQALRAAVVAQACEEFLNSTPRRGAYIISWIRSEDFAFFSDLDPEAIISQLYKMRKRGIRHLFPIFA